MPQYLITGATGYIGSMLTKYIKAQDSAADIAVLVRDTEKAMRLLPDGLTIVQADLSDRNAVGGLELGCDYILHCASATKSAEMVSHPVEVAESIINTAQNVLELAKRRRIKSMVHLSSMEVYGNIDCSDGHRVTEGEVAKGEIELFRSRSSYPLGKRMAESICYFYYKEYGVPVKIARLAQTFGRGILPSDNRVFAQFAKSVKSGTDIVLHTSGNSMGNYCGIDDAITGILTILKDGADGEAYNVVNEKNTMSVRQMAELVARELAGGRIQVTYDMAGNHLHGYAADTGLRLSGAKLEALGWKPDASLEDMYRDLCGGMRRPIPIRR